MGKKKKIRFSKGTISLEGLALSDLKGVDRFCFDPTGTALEARGIKRVCINRSKEARVPVDDASATKKGYRIGKGGRLYKPFRPYKDASGKLVTKPKGRSGGMTADKFINMLKKNPKGKQIACAMAAKKGKERSKFADAAGKSFKCSGNAIPKKVGAKKKVGVETEAFLDASFKKWVKAREKRLAKKIGYGVPKGR